MELDLPRDLPQGQYQLVISDADRYVQDEQSAEPFRFTAEKAADVFDVLKEMAGIRHNALYVRLIRQPDGWRSAAPRCRSSPPSRRQILLGGGRSNITPFVSSTVKIIPTEQVMAGSAEFQLTVETKTKVEGGGGAGRGPTQPAVGRPGQARRAQAAPLRADGEGAEGQGQAASKARAARRECDREDAKCAKRTRRKSEARRRAQRPSRLSPAYRGAGGLGRQAGRSTLTGPDYEMVHVNRRAVAAAVVVGGTALAVGTSNWSHTTEADFKNGTFDNVVATNLGDLKLSRAVKTLLEQDPQVSAVYAMAEATDGTVYAGTGPQGCCCGSRARRSRRSRRSTTRRTSSRSCSTRTAGC